MLWSHIIFFMSVRHRRAVAHMFTLLDYFQVILPHKPRSQQNESSMLLLFSPAPHSQFFLGLMTTSPFVVLVLAVLVHVRDASRLRGPVPDSVWLFDPFHLFMWLCVRRAHIFAVGSLL
jgi:hypothetical protein